MPSPPRPSFTSAPSEPAIRRLGVRSSSHIDRPIRAPWVVAAVGALILLSIPLYLLRTPPASEPEKAPPDAPSGFASSVPAGLEKKSEDERMTLGEVVRVQCSSSPGRSGKSGRLCDEQKFWGEALAQAIKESFDCAPQTGEEGTLNYVLTVDYTAHKLHVFPGASGMWKGPQARRATECVKRALPAPEWEKLSHDFRYYELAILATYSPPPPTEMPLFE